MSKKKLGGHGTCLGDFVQNIAKFGVFLLIFRGTWGKFYTVSLDRTN